MNSVVEMRCIKIVLFILLLLTWVNHIYIEKNAKIIETHNEAIVTNVGTDIVLTNYTQDNSHDILLISNRLLQVERKKH